MKVFWAVLFERYMAFEPVERLLDIAALAAQLGAARMSVPYAATDTARNIIVDGFLRHTDDPNDLLIMLDNDHLHPADIVEQLARHDPARGVVGALYFRRGEPYDPMFYLRTASGQLRNPAVFNVGPLYEAACIGTGAIAIRRWVFDKLQAAGVEAPFFRYYQYQANGNRSTEDIYFGDICERAGIAHYVDTSLISPHQRTSFVGLPEWEAQMRTRPELLATEEG